MAALRGGGGSHKEKLSRKEFLKSGAKIESTDKLNELRVGSKQHSTPDGWPDD